MASFTDQRPGFWDDPEPERRDFARLRQVEAGRQAEDVKLIAAQLAGLWPLVREACGNQTARDLFDEKMATLTEIVGWVP